MQFNYFLEDLFYPLLTLWFSCSFLFLWIKLNKKLTNKYFLLYLSKFEEINKINLTEDKIDKFKFIVFDINYAFTPIGGYIFLKILDIIDFIFRVLNITYKKENKTYPSINIWCIIIFIAPIYFIAFCISCIFCIYANLLSEKLCVFLFE